MTATLAIGLASCASFKHLTQVSNTFPPARDCGKCHVDIYSEWSQSDHAHAYVNPHFREATDDYAFEDCLSCHAPEPTLTAGQPAVRFTGREEGVTCVSCHLAGGVLSGPLEPTGKVHPHPIGVRPEVYHDSGICGRCHKGTMVQWNAAPSEKKTCQECHMEPVARKVTQTTGGISNLLVAMEKQVPQKRHNFSILNDAQSQGLIALRIVSSGDSLDISIENGLPHDLPTGDFGFRVVTLEVFGIDAGGNSMLLGGWELAPEAATAIPAHGTRTWSLHIAGSVRTVRAVLTRRSYDQETLALAQTQAEVAEP